MAHSSCANYQPGDLLYHGMPFMRVMRMNMWNKLCGNCLGQSDLKTCKACGLMKYCSRECQKISWSDHKLECTRLKCLTPLNQVMVQMVGNIILKIKERDWRTITEKVMGKEVSFYDLISRTDDLSKLPTLFNRRYFQDLTALVTEYAGNENMPNKTAFMEIVGKVVFNQFGDLGTSIAAPVVTSLYIGVSKFDHSCIPNSAVICDGNVMSVRACKSIDKQTGKVTISYSPLVLTLEASEMSRLFKESFGSGCYCEDCSQPYGTSPLTKILDISKSNQVIEETKRILTLASSSADLNDPIGGIMPETVRSLLEKQEGVLDDTNLLRMRTLALKCIHLNGSLDEINSDLKQLAKWMSTAFGAHYLELMFVYAKLVDINCNLKDFEAADVYRLEMDRVKTVCTGQDFLSDPKLKSQISKMTNYCSQTTFFSSLSKVY